MGNAAMGSAAMGALWAVSATACWAQGSVGAPTPTGIPPTGTKSLGKADRKAACRGRPIPRG
ncbi:hypothetical protein M446_1847 [Methylobacterium sp. 4-46]|nr:hypothetical protein M446_1847 [Methylobacterium sp. 4-46]